MHRIVLAVMIVIYAMLGLLYAVRTPKWQAPDEPAHFNYVRAIGDTGSLPVLQPGDYDQAYLEEIKAAKFPASMPVDSIRYESYQPPLYYLSAAPIYLATRGAGLDAQILALRLYSVVLGLVILLVAYALVREIFPGEQLLALATVGVIATIPMQIATTASISNDTAGELVLALILLLSIQRIKGAVTDRQFILMGGILFGIALLTKVTAYPTGAALLIGAEVAQTAIRRSVSQGLAVSPRRSLAHLFALFMIALAISSPMFIRNVLTYGIADPLGLARHDTVVFGQPTTAEMIRQYGLNHILFDFLAVTFKSFWAQFGWMGVLVNDRIYVALFGLTAAAGLGLVLYALKVLRRRELLSPSQWAALALVALLLAMSIVDYIGYNFKFFQLQGRYLFPAIISIGLLFSIGLSEILAKEYARVMFALLYVSLVGLDVACLFLYIVPQLQA